MPARARDSRRSSAIGRNSLRSPMAIDTNAAATPMTIQINPSVTVVPSSERMWINNAIVIKTASTAHPAASTVSRERIEMRCMLIIG